MSDLLIIVGGLSFFYTPRQERKTNDFSKNSVVELRQLCVDLRLPTTGTKADLIDRLEIFYSGKDDYALLTVAALKEKCRERGLVVSGLKSELISRLEDSDQDTGKNRVSLADSYHSFRRQYLVVYSIIMLADWMQGTHMYTLYMSYGVNVSALFLTGFLTGGMLAPFLGSFVDKFGRKRSCIVYCILEIAINLMEGFDSFPILIMGRILGGISTNLLFSSFESWMNTEHRRRGYPESWMSTTYSQCSIINGGTAVLAGIVSQLLEDSFGQIGPFHGAVFLTALALVIILPWPENYGEKKAGEHEKSSVVRQFVDGWRVTLSDINILRIGIVQALSEGAMYTFVFMWVPTLLSLEPPGGLPTGCVFSSLMIAITIGGLVSSPLSDLVSRSGWCGDSTNELSATLVYTLASLSMTVPVFCLSTVGSEVKAVELLILGSFLVVEFCVGLFGPVAGTLRSKYVPDNLQGAILNIFRLPLNIVVVLGTQATEIYDASVVFQMVSVTFLCAALLQATMISSSVSRKPKTA